MGWGGHDHWTWGITEWCGRVVPSPLYLLGGGGGGGLDMTWGITEGCGRVVPSPLHLLGGGGGGGAGHDLGNNRGVWPSGDVVGHNVLSCRADIIIRGNAGSSVLI